MCQRKVQMFPHVGIRESRPEASDGLEEQKAFSKDVRSNRLCLYAFQRDTREDPMIEVGTEAPDFALRSHQGENVSLGQFKGDKWVVLHTFPPGLHRRLKQPDRQLQPCVEAIHRRRRGAFGLKRRLRPRP